MRKAYLVLTVDVQSCNVVDVGIYSSPAGQLTGHTGHAGVRYFDHLEVPGADFGEAVEKMRALVYSHDYFEWCRKWVQAPEGLQGITVEAWEAAGASPSDVAVIRSFLDGRKSVPASPDTVRSLGAEGVDLDWAAGVGLLTIPDGRVTPPQGEAWYLNGVFHREDGPAKR